MSRQQARSEEEEARRREMAQVRQDFAITFGGESGERVLRYLEKRFETDLPAWRTPELADWPAAVCDTMAKLRDGNREVVAEIRRLAGLI